MTYCINELEEQLNDYFSYHRFPDFIVNLLADFDKEANLKYNKAYLDQTSGLLIKAEKGSIKNIFCSPFISEEICEYFIKLNITDALLIIKHPMDWNEFDIGFIPVNKESINELKSRNISVYCAHAAHDNQFMTAPSFSLAKQLGIGKIGQRLLDKQERAFGQLLSLNHPLTPKQFCALLFEKTGSSAMQAQIKNQSIKKVAIIAGGGDNSDWLKVAQDYGCDTYLTGILKFEGSDYARKHNPSFVSALKQSSLNAFGLSHYVSEKFGSIRLVDELEGLFNVRIDFIEESQKLKKIEKLWNLNI